MLCTSVKQSCVKLQLATDTDFFLVYFGIFPANADWFCEQTKDEDGKANKKEEMDFDGEYAQDTGDGETFEGGYDYADCNYDGYEDGGGGGAYNDYDDVDF